MNLHTTLHSGDGIHPDGLLDNTLGVQEVNHALRTIHLSDGEIESDEEQEVVLLKVPKSPGKHRRRKSSRGLGLLGIDGRSSSTVKGSNSQHRQPNQVPHNPRAFSKQAKEPSETTLITEISHATLDTSVRSSVDPLIPALGDTSKKRRSLSLGRRASASASSSRNHEPVSSLAESLGGSFARWIKRGTSNSKASSSSDATSSKKDHKKKPKNKNNKLSFLASNQSSHHQLQGSWSSINSYHQMMADPKEGVIVQKVSSHDLSIDDNQDGADDTKAKTIPESTSTPFEDIPVGILDHDETIKKNQEETQSEKQSRPEEDKHQRKKRVSSRGRRRKTRSKKKDDLEETTVSSRSHRHLMHYHQECHDEAISQRRERSKSKTRRDGRSPTRPSHEYAHYPAVVTRNNLDEPKPEHHQARRSRSSNAIKRGKDSVVHPPKTSHNLDGSKKRERRHRRSKSSNSLLHHLSKTSTPASPGRRQRLLDAQHHDDEEKRSRRSRSSNQLLQHLKKTSAPAVADHCRRPDDYDRVDDSSMALSHVPTKSTRLDDSSQSTRSRALLTSTHRRSFSANGLPRKREQRERHISSMLSIFPALVDDQSDKSVSLVDASRRERRRALHREHSFGSRSTTATDLRRRRRAKERALKAEAAKALPDMTLLPKEPSNRSLSKESSSRKLERKSSRRSLRRRSLSRDRPLQDASDRQHTHEKSHRRMPESNKNI